jgi:hypothetical protein
LAAGLAGSIWQVILIIFLQSKLVLCAAVGAGRIETAAAGIYEGQQADISPAPQSRVITSEIGL